MKPVIKVLDGDMPLHQILEDGYYAELLRNNPVFSRAINEMYFNLTLQEDKVTASLDWDDREATQLRRKYSMLRSLLTELVVTLDGYVNEANQVKEDDIEDEEITTQETH